MSENIENQSICGTPTKLIISRFHGSTPNSGKKREIRAARAPLGDKLKEISGWKANPDSTNFKAAHSGIHGHALEKELGCDGGNKSEPDIKIGGGAFEIKSCKETSPLVTLCDVSPNVIIEGVGRWWSSAKANLGNKQVFLESYGIYNEKKGRFSWTAKLVVGRYNKLDQMLKITSKGIFVVHKNDSTLFGWTHDLLKKRVENKFCASGFAICKRNKVGVYSDFFIGNPITYCDFLEGLSQGDVFLGPGTYMGNPRPYMIWKAKKSWLESAKFSE